VGRAGAQTGLVCERHVGARGRGKVLGRGAERSCEAVPGCGAERSCEAVPGCGAERSCEAVPGCAAVPGPAAVRSCRAAWLGPGAATRGAACGHGVAWAASAGTYLERAVPRWAR
jgi:hypothetical protein